MIKLTVKQVKGIYIDNTRRPKLEDTQLGISKICSFHRNIQQEAFGQRETTAGVTIFSKLPWVQERALLGLGICP